MFQLDRVTNVAGATATISFDGNAIRLYGAVSNNHGPFTLSLDGGPLVHLTGAAYSYTPKTLLVLAHDVLIILYH
jgi:hypothetical protein